ncbi:hypothetical protein B5G06_10340 [Flavonifractor sp. An52]|uniref:hypothetical protein n=1 Tax=Flavonifractor sp. An52 TaxID=1965642 RepID=UPI000B378D7A|nr:hypothetical protein [Flavonifractor sp. An52]OUN81355.1 hypothetical protein B5G06_10340 [Flavonifractor sp. An52]
MRKTILSLALAVAMMAALTACSGGGDPVGTYEATKVGDSNEERNMMEWDSSGLTRTSGILEIKSGGSATATFTTIINPEAEEFLSAQDLATLKSMASSSDESASGTWQMKGNKITISFPGSPWTGTVDGDTIKFLGDSNSYIIFEKIK